MSDWTQHHLHVRPSPDCHLCTTSPKLCRICKAVIPYPTERQLRKGDYLCRTHRQHERERYVDSAEQKRRFRACAIRWRNNPENKVKIQAEKKAYRALKQGLLKRPSKCDKCDKTGRTEMHHPDYAKPLEVRFLCKSCHGIVTQGTNAALAERRLLFRFRTFVTHIRNDEFFHPCNSDDWMSAFSAWLTEERDKYGPSND